MGPDAMILVFWMLSFHSPLSLFSRGSLVLLHFLPIRVVSSAYLRLLTFLPAILIPACASSSQAFHMMYSAYKLNKQGDNIQPWRTPFPICNQSVIPCPVLTVASWSAYRFLRSQVRWSGVLISLTANVSSSQTLLHIIITWGKCFKSLYLGLTPQQLMQNLQEFSTVCCDPHSQRL